MSHIPSSAMPHAKPHEHVEPAAESAKSKAAATKPFPWAAAIGGALAAGAAITAAVVAGRLAGATKPRRERKEAEKRGTAKTRKPRRKADAAD